MRAWDAYIGLENVVKNMLTSLRAVSELQNPAIRDRHWQQLMAATKVRNKSLQTAAYYLYNFFSFLLLFFILLSSSPCLPYKSSLSSSPFSFLPRPFYFKPVFFSLFFFFLHLLLLSYSIFFLFFS